MTRHHCLEVNMVDLWMIAMMIIIQMINANAAQTWHLSKLTCHRNGIRLGHPSKFFTFVFLESHLKDDGEAGSQGRKHYQWKAQCFLVLPHNVPAHERLNYEYWWVTLQGSKYMFVLTSLSSWATLRVRGELWRSLCILFISSLNFSTDYYCFPTNYSLKIKGVLRVHVNMKLHLLLKHSSFEKT